MSLPAIPAPVGETPTAPVFLADDFPVVLKLEGANPTGSVKDRACVAMIREALRRGRLRPGMRLLDASSGNFASSLAYYGRVLGFPVTVVCGSKLTAEKAAYLDYFGAETDLHGDFTIQGNERCRELARARPDRYCFVDQLHNWANPRAHFAGTGPELLRQVPGAAIVVGSLGSGGTLCGVAEYLRRLGSPAKVVAVAAAPSTRIPGTGAFADGDYLSPFIRRARARGHFDLWVEVTEAQATAMLEPLRDQGFFCGIQTGGVLHAATVARSRWPDLGGDVVAISGDAGWKSLTRLRSAVAAEEPALAEVAR